MCRKQEIIEPHRRLRRVGMTVRILGFNRRRVEEGRRGDGIAGKAKNVESREIYCEAECGLAEVVRYGLGVEGQGPGLWG